MKFIFVISISESVEPERSEKYNVDESTKIRQVKKDTKKYSLLILCFTSSPPIIINRNAIAYRDEYLPTDASCKNPKNNPKKYR